MKSLIIGLTLLSSVSVFAANNCESLTGQYNCNYQGQDLALTVSVVGEEFKASIAGDEMILTLDGLAHKSDASDDVQKATCSAKKQIVDVESSFRGELTALLSFAKTTSGITYTIVDGNNKSIVLKCLKTK